jgi:hypothetical protein
VPSDCKLLSKALAETTAFAASFVAKNCKSDNDVLCLTTALMMEARQIFEALGRPAGAEHAYEQLAMFAEISRPLAPKGPLN